MAERIEIRKEAIARQGTVIQRRRTRYLIEGDQRKARFQMGEEGLVHYAIEQSSGTKYRIKCFWEPDDSRLERSRYLVKQGLADLGKNSADVLAGAPFALIDSVGGLSRFALIMKNVEGGSWKDLRQDAEQLGEYPPPNWPSFRTRLTWAYGLACAVERMEARGFIHADLSDGNVVVLAHGERAGEIALVDFDAYFNPVHPSNYRGTSGFVAPEIWNRGPTGVGSDRVAMSVLIQDLLLLGDPDLGAEEAFRPRYTQEQICAFQGSPHPLLRERSPQLADLMEATLRTAAPEQRPGPQEWRQALLAIYHGAPGPRFRLDSIPEDSNLRIWMSSGERRDLSVTPFGIRADLMGTPDGALHLRVHEGAKVRVRFSEGSWRELSGGEDVRVSGDASIFGREGKLAGRLTLEQPAEEAIGLAPESFDTPPPEGWPMLWARMLSEVEGINLQQWVYFLVGFVAVILLLFFARSL